jgi:hypothetical protein
VSASLFFFGSLFVKCSGTDRQDPQAMEKFSRLTGVAAPLPVVNIDTDMIIPKDYLKTIKRTGLGKGLFAEARYNEDGSENRISCSISPHGAMHPSSSQATISAAARRASMPLGRSSISASAA